MVRGDTDLKETVASLWRTDFAPLGVLSDP
jgi:hypothetical protein